MESYPVCPSIVHSLYVPTFQTESPKKDVFLVLFQTTVRAEGPHYNAILHALQFF